MEVKEGATVVQQNQFDGLNRRIVRDESGGSGNLRHFYYNQQWQVLEERVGTGTTATKQYVYHPHYVDAIALSYDSAGVEHYYLQDANFNVTAVTDNTGTVVERYSYTPYGEVTVLNPDFSAVVGNVSAISNELLYTGRRLDPETGLQLNRNRFYHQQLGRWVNRDPILYTDGMNLFSYVGSSPVLYVDTHGLLRDCEDEYFDCVDEAQETRELCRKLGSRLCDYFYDLDVSDCTVDKKFCDEENEEDQNRNPEKKKTCPPCEQKPQYVTGYPGQGLEIALECMFEWALGEPINLPPPLGIPGPLPGRPIAPRPMPIQQPIGVP